MKKTVISYEKELPEIPGRSPYLPPAQHLEKVTGREEEWAVKEGRRVSELLLVNNIRKAVDAWRATEYEGASEVTRRLFEYWFNEDHDIEGFPTPFRYYFCQREAIETLVYLVEIAGNTDSQALLDAYAALPKIGLMDSPIEYSTGMDAQRMLRYFDPRTKQYVTQNIPPPNLRRYAFKMATGSGKTWVIAMAVVWSYFHRKMVEGSTMARNFAIIAPNVIVYQRLERDFASNRIFNQLPLIPPEWRGSWLKVILRGDTTEPDATGNLFLTNIHQIYQSREKEWTPDNAVQAILGPPPSKNLAAADRTMLERIRSLKELAVINDEAHHVHDDDLEWNKTLLDLYYRMQSGLALWLDFSATPKFQNGSIFPWAVCDYPLAQAVEDRIVKAPIIVSKPSDPGYPGADPEKVTADDVVEKYGYWIEAAVARWKEHTAAFKKLDVKPVLFIMVEKNPHADAIGKALSKDFGIKESEVLVIHTDTKGEISKGDLDKLREEARDIDDPKIKRKVIVSVLMLREGWDVKNVSVVLGLRPYSAKAEILPEQVIGRGLRLMPSVSPDMTQTLEVLGTQGLLDVLREQLELEGVSVVTVSSNPDLPITIEPVQEKLEYNIHLPITKPSMTHDVRKLAELDASTMQAIYHGELSSPETIKLRMEFATLNVLLGTTEIKPLRQPLVIESLSAIANKAIERARLGACFNQVYPIVRDYVCGLCFGKPVDLESEDLRRVLAHPVIREQIAKYLAGIFGSITVERMPLEFENESHSLADTKPFGWRRNLKPEPLKCKKTIFNFVATFNDFERSFARFLDKADDVLRFAALGTTEQGSSGAQFRVDYLKGNGAIGFYHPDFVAVQKTKQGDVHWILETKGRVYEDTTAKDAAMKLWCERITTQTGSTWLFRRIDQSQFEKLKDAASLALLFVGLQSSTLYN